MRFGNVIIRNEEAFVETAKWAIENGKFEEFLSAIQYVAQFAKDPNTTRVILFRDPSLGDHGFGLSCQKLQFNCRDVIETEDMIGARWHTDLSLGMVYHEAEDDWSFHS